MEKVRDLNSSLCDIRGHSFTYLLNRPQYTSCYNIIILFGGGNNKHRDRSLKYWPKM